MKQTSSLGTTSLELIPMGVDMLCGSGCGRAEGRGYSMTGVPSTRRVVLLGIVKKNSSLRLPTSHKCKTLSSGPVIHQFMNWTGDADTHPSERPAESSLATTHLGPHNTARETECAESKVFSSQSPTLKRVTSHFPLTRPGRHQGHV